MLQPPPQPATQCGTSPNGQKDSAMSTFSDLMNAPARIDGSSDTDNSGGASVVQEQHDKSKITAEARDSARAWDAYEYGVTREAAMAMDEDAVAAMANQRANLATGADGRVSMFSALTVPWHGLGTTIDQAATSAEALTFSGLANWALEKVSSYVDIAGNAITTGQYAIVRQDKGVVLGNVGARYQIVSNEDCFAFLDSVIDGDSTRYETAGALGNGERVWLLARLGTDEEVAAGDKIEKFAMLTTTHDGTGSIRVYPTAVRTECQNTYRLTIPDQKRGIAIRHTRNVASKISAAKQALGLAKDVCDEFVETARALESKDMPEPTGFFRQALDMMVDRKVAGETVTQSAIDDGSLQRAIAGLSTVADREKAERQLASVEKRRGELFLDIVNRYESDTCKGQSAWAAVNAVSECIDHSDKMHYRGDDTARAENKMVSILEGRAQQLTSDVLQMAINA